MEGSPVTLPQENCLEVSALPLSVAGLETPNSAVLPAIVQGPSFEKKSSPRSKQRASKHMSIKLDGKSVFICKLCPQKCTSGSSLTRHIRYKHTFERRFKCDMCDYTSVEEDKMAIHKRSHTGECPYHCDTCGASFKSKVSLWRHCSTHSSIREYICVLCFQQFTIGNTLRCHMRTVHAVENVHLDGMRCTDKDGIPETVKLYFESLGYTAENAMKNMNVTKLRFYHVKEEFTASYRKNFRKVPQLICSNSDDSSDSDCAPRTRKHKLSEAVLKRTFLGSSEKRAVPGNTNKCNLTHSGKSERKTRSVSKRQQMKNKVNTDVGKKKMTGVAKKRKMGVGRKRKAEFTSPKKSEKLKQTKVDDVKVENIKTGEYKEIIEEGTEEERYYDFVLESENEENNDIDPDVYIDEDDDGDVSDVVTEELDESNCIRLEEDTDSRLELLQGMKGGAFGKHPCVIKVLDDGSVVNITHTYKDYLPR